MYFLRNSRKLGCLVQVNRGCIQLLFFGNNLKCEIRQNVWENLRDIIFSRPTKLISGYYMTCSL